MCWSSITILNNDTHTLFSFPFIPDSLVIGERLSSWQKIGLNETGTECMFVKSTGKNYRMNGWILCKASFSSGTRNRKWRRKRILENKEIVSGNFKTLHLWKLELVVVFPVITHILFQLTYITQPNLI